MANLKTDSPLSSRIVRSFLHFLNSVEPSDGADTEALEVAKDCLAEAFKIDQSSIGTSDSLIDIFSSREETRSSLGNNGVPEVPTSSRGKNAAVSEAPQSSNQDQDGTSEPHSLGSDELFGKFFDVLEKIHYFRRMPNGNDDQIQLDRATHLFHNAVQEMKTAGCQTFDQKGLAEAFKAQGNKAMQSKRYIDAIELYTLAIALCENNAVYYCNRAAAFTQIRRYNEAVQDCLKSMEIDPNYSKAYSRLGFAYFSQGRYREAIDKGYQKALQLDPNNDSVKDNIRVAEQKLKEAQRRAGPGQSSTSTSHGQPSPQSGGGSRSSSIPRPPPGPPPPSFPMHPPFSMHPPPPFSMHQPPFPMPPPPFSASPMPHPPPFSASYSMNGYPTDFSSMMMNMTGNMFPPHFQDGHEGEIGDSPENEPEVRVDGNVNVNFNVGEMPNELSDAFRSMMGMFSAPAPNGNQQEQNNNGRPGPS